MRETTITIDDITVHAAKGKLATIAERPGYLDALKPPPRGARTAQYIMLALTVLFGALTYACFAAMEPGLLRVALFIVLLLLSLFFLMAALGAAPSPVPTLWAAAVVGETHEQRDGDSAPVHRLVLLDEKGDQHELVADATIADALRVGDLGVAHVQDKLLVKFVRL